MVTQAFELFILRLGKLLNGWTIIQKKFIVGEALLVSDTQLVSCLMVLFLVSMLRKRLIKVSEAVFPILCIFLSFGLRLPVFVEDVLSGGYHGQRCMGRRQGTHHLFADGLHDWLRLLLLIFVSVAELAEKDDLVITFEV